MTTIQVQGIVTCLVLGVGIGAGAFTVARTKISQPFRAWVTTKSPWLGNLVGCPYCVSHWIALAAVAIYRPRPVMRFELLDWATAWFLTVALAAIVVGFITRAIAPPPPGGSRG